MLSRAFMLQIRWTNENNTVMSHHFPIQEDVSSSKSNLQFFQKAIICSNGRLQLFWHKLEPVLSNIIFPGDPWFVDDSMRHQRLEKGTRTFRVFLLLYYAFLPLKILIAVLRSIDYTYIALLLICVIIRVIIILLFLLL